MSSVSNIFSVRYARVELVQNTCLSGRGGEDAPLDLDFFFTVLDTDQGPVLIDTGYNLDVAAARNRFPIVAPADALSELGIDPVSVRTVVLTHLHYDHAGNTDLFPTAEFYLQRAEWDFVNSDFMDVPMLSEHYAQADRERVRQLHRDGRLRLLDGEHQLTPDIRLVPVPGHSPGMQVAVVKVDKGTVVLANDACHYYAEARDLTPFPVYTDILAKLRGYERLEQLAGSDGWIVAGHDPEVMRRFPVLEGNLNIVRSSEPPLFAADEAKPHPAR